MRHIVLYVYCLCRRISTFVKRNFVSLVPGSPLLSPLTLMTPRCPLSPLLPQPTVPRRARPHPLMTPRCPMSPLLPQPTVPRRATWTSLSPWTTTGPLSTPSTPTPSSVPEWSITVTFIAGSATFVNNSCMIRDNRNWKNTKRVICQLSSQVYPLYILPVYSIIYLLFSCIIYLVFSRNFKYLF